MASSGRRARSQSEDKKPGLGFEPAADHAAPLEEGITTIDTHGDLIITITSNDGSHSQAFKVNSGCVRHACPAWARADSSSAKPTHLELHDNHVKWIEMALRLAHLERKYLPNRVTFWGLVDLSEICRTHGLLELFRPYVRNWAHPWLSKLYEPGYKLWIVIAYGLGFKSIFESLSVSLARRIVRDEGGQRRFLSHDMTTENELDRIPQSLWDHLLRIRLDMLEGTITTCYDLIAKFSKPDAIVCVHGTSHHSRSLCTKMALGSLVQGLRGCEIWPDHPQAATIQQSVDGLRHTIGLIDIHGTHGTSFNYCAVAESQLLPSILLGDGKLTVFAPGSECDNYFAELPEKITENDLRIWEYAWEKRQCQGHGLLRSASSTADEKTSLQADGHANDQDNHEDKNDVVDVASSGSTMSEVFDQRGNYISWADVYDGSDWESTDSDKLSEIATEDWDSESSTSMSA